MLNWFLGYSSSLDEEPAETLEIAPYQDDPNVPGEAQLIMCRAGLLPDYNYASNSLNYKWCEDVYWHYTTLLDVRKKPGFEPYISLNYLDYRYTIRANGKVLADSEGMFTPVVLSLAEFEGSPVKLEVIIHPVPKVPGAPDTRDQARESVKPPVSYGWDWHPRLVTAGISGEVKFDYRRSIGFPTLSLTIRSLTRSTLSNCRSKPESSVSRISSYASSSTRTAKPSPRASCRFRATAISTHCPS